MQLVLSAELFAVSRTLFVIADGTSDQLAGFYKFKGEDGAHMVLSSDLIDGVDADCDAACMSEFIRKSMERAPSGAWDNFRVRNTHIVSLTDFI